MKYSIQLTPLALAICMAHPALAQSQAMSGTVSGTMPEVRVVGQAMPQPLAGSDSSQLLSNVAGYNVAAGGGVSGLPVMNGFADDRLKIRIDGMELSSACANHMNAPLSYIAPKQVGKIRMLAGLTPVSMGGDSIGGSIEVESAPAEFADAPGLLRSSGSVSLGARSVDRSVSAALSAGVANDRLSIAYSGNRVRANSYRDGNGDQVRDSLYKSTNQSLTMAAQGGGQLLTLRLGTQRIPYQGFPNQYMDMTRNHADFANLNYNGALAWGKLDARLYWQRTEHDMGFFSAERAGKMPMLTEGRDRGYAVKAELPLAAGAALRLGHEYHSFRLEDYWPSVPGAMMMSPLVYLNIHDGKRDRVVLFAEWDHNINAQWSTQLGLRGERVNSDAGQVQPYNYTMMNAADVDAAKLFNSRDHARRDNNVDLTALARYEAGAGASYEFGYARKTRSPNLYERYSWGRGTMAMRMINWFGDGNGYVGNLDLNPEVAHTLSASADWHDAARQRWSVKVTPYFSFVRDYIDADAIGSFKPYSVKTADGRLLRFANHDARLYGVNLAWNLALAQDARFGKLALKGTASITRGERTDGLDLYRMMPFNASVALEQAQGAWHNTLEAKLVGRKHLVDSQRLEPETGAYAVFNARAQYQAGRNVSLTAGVSNLFNRYYADPMGGVDLAGMAASRSGTLRALPGYGRSFDLGLTYSF